MANGGPLLKRAGVDVEFLCLMMLDVTTEIFQKAFEISSSRPLFMVVSRYPYKVYPIFYKEQFQTSLSPQIRRKRIL